MVEVDRVQRFWPTAPAEGDPGGSPCTLCASPNIIEADKIAAWYTNPQTEAFCGMLGVENKINPAPVT
jgi:lariat debranching enzyme